MIEPDEPPTERTFAVVSGELRATLQELANAKEAEGDARRETTRVTNRVNKLRRELEQCMSAIEVEMRKLGFSEADVRPARMVR